MATPVHLALLSVATAAAGAAAFLIIWRSRNSPDERERLRRLSVHASGRLIDGIVREVKGSSVYYAYSWRGIDYDASQDLTSMAALLPGPADSLIGPVTVKFLPRNPYNSIVLCELWSGFPRHKTNRRRVVKEAI